MLLREMCSVLNIVQLASPRETMKSKSPSWNSRSAESETVLDERTLGMMRDLGTTVGFCVGIATKPRKGTPYRSSRLLDICGDRRFSRQA